MSAAKRRRRSWRHSITVLAVLFLAATTAALCLAWSRRAHLPAPPVIDLTEIDPAVERTVVAARAAVVQSPESADAWGKLGMVLQSHGLSLEAAHACFAEAERLDPRQPRWPYFQVSFLLSGDPEAALTKLQRTVQLCDCVPDAPRLRLAEELLDQGRLPEASEQFLRVLQQQPGNARASLGLGRLAYERGELSEGIAHLNRCLDDAHTRKAAHVLLAQTYERLGNKHAAAQELHQAGELANDTPWPDPFQDELLQLRVGKRAILAGADHLLHQNRFPEALRLLKRAVRDYPDEAWAWVMFGRAHLGLPDLPAAEQALRKATEVGPDVAEAQFYLGVALFLQKNHQAAATCFRKATELKPHFALAHYNLGHSLKEQGDDAGAVAAFRTAINCKPDYAAAHFNLAALLVKKGQRDEALVHLRHAVELDATNQAAKQLLEQVQRSHPNR